MTLHLQEKPAVRRRDLTLEALRTLVNRALATRTECEGIHIRRIIVTEPDASGCNWEVEWPVFRPANTDPCHSQMRELIAHLRLRFNVGR
ncbi:MAG TPA: hypothetical protein VMN79_18935 [Casimicrobiaceae bacterium]|nr:hypothetical protein [Casimicrobiaceae bacterium]